MNGDQWCQTISGRAFNLMNPQARDVDFTSDIALTLAKIPRFNGATEDGGVWSVAEHCCTAADVAFSSTHDKKTAAYLLLHDAHEAYIGDITTPTALALAAHANAEFVQRRPATQAAKPADSLPDGKGGYEPGFIVQAALKRLKFTLDAAIHEAAGLAWPPPPETVKLIKFLDGRLMITERNHMMKYPPKPWGLSENFDPLPMKGALCVSKKTPIAKATDWLERLDKYCPQARRKSGDAYAELSSLAKTAVYTAGARR